MDGFWVLLPRWHHFRGFHNPCASAQFAKHHQLLCANLAHLRDPSPCAPILHFVSQMLPCVPH